MSEKNETLAEIEEELRSGEYAPLANRIEAAAKRERGNAAALREALGKLRAELWNNTVIAGKKKIALYEIADAALSAPPRNCDVMSLAVARKVWFMKEIMPRLIGDLPLGKEIPFEEWLFAPANEKGENDGK